MNVTRGNEDGKNASWGDISTVWVDALDGVRGSQHGSQQVATTNLYSLVVATPLCLTTTESSLSADERAVETHRQLLLLRPAHGAPSR